MSNILQNLALVAPITLPISALAFSCPPLEEGKHGAEIWNIENIITTVKSDDLIVVITHARPSSKNLPSGILTFEILCSKRKDCIALDTLKTSMKILINASIFSIKNLDTSVNYYPGRDVRRRTYQMISKKYMPSYSAGACKVRVI